MLLLERNFNFFNDAIIDDRGIMQKVLIFGFLKILNQQIRFIKRRFSRIIL